MPPSTFANLLILYARRFPIRRGKLGVINLLWRAAVGGQSTHRVAVLNHGGLKMSVMWLPIEGAPSKVFQ
jgi:hypothetical protein